MPWLSTYLAYQKLRQTQWLQRADIRKLQNRKLQTLIRHAYQTVPFYRAHFDGANVKPEDIRSFEDLSIVPPVTKSELQSADPKDIVSNVFSAEQLRSEHTSGSTGQPFTVRFDPHFVAVRDGLFLRSLTAAGYRVGQKMMLVTDVGHKRSRPWLRWRYVSITDPVDEMIAALNEFKPQVLYGCMTPLRQMARALKQTGSGYHQPKVLISTAEVLGRATRQLLEEVFQADVYDVYGLTEMGMVAWECRQHQGYHLSEDTVITEITREDNGEAGRLVMTNLEMLSMPLIRFQTGDLAQESRQQSCPCGRDLRLIERVEGRLLDSITLANGQTISPYRFTLEIEKIPEIERYQLIQEKVNKFLLRIEGRAGEDRQIENLVRQKINFIVEHDVELSVRREPNLDPKPGQKFRVVKSELQ